MVTQLAPDLKPAALLEPASRARQAALGQFFTPSPIATFMAGMFPASGLTPIKLLDPGAGQGALSAAFLERVRRDELGPADSVTAYELDDRLVPTLRSNLSGSGVASARVLGGDFIEQGVDDVRAGRRPYTHAILNPPYKKISTGSKHRALLRAAGIETVNLYSAFVALALLLLKGGGQLCAIVPRSFCNGPYYRPFRDLLFRHAALLRIHLFDARNSAFADDDVLQENVVILLERGARQGMVTLSSSTDADFSDLQQWTVPFAEVVKVGDCERMIHVPPRVTPVSVPEKFNARLTDLELFVSTGPVVDFRMRDHLRDLPEADTVALLYPGHFGRKGLSWPKGNPKKPSAIVRNPQTEKWLYPNGNYTVVRRFSSKEERRRIVANVVPGESLPGDRIGFENHLNVFHRGRHGLPQAIALGLMTYLNSSMIDSHFRAFNGHTQVNATDLRSLPYPSEDRLFRIAKWAAQNPDPSQEAIDGYLMRMK